MTWGKLLSPRLAQNNHSVNNGFFSLCCFLFAASTLHTRVSWLIYLSPFQEETSNPQQVLLPAPQQNQFQEELHPT